MVNHGGNRTVSSEQFVEQDAIISFGLIVVNILDDERKGGKTLVGYAHRLGEDKSSVD